MKQNQIQLKFSIHVTIVTREIEKSSVISNKRVEVAAVRMLSFVMSSLKFVVVFWMTACVFNF